MGDIFQKVTFFHFLTWAEKIYNNCGWENLLLFANFATSAKMCAKQRHLLCPDSLILGIDRCKKHIRMCRHHLLIRREVCSFCGAVNAVRD